METKMLLGLTLDDALERLKREGIAQPAIEWTAAPRGAYELGTPRVVRVCGERLTVARFPGLIRQAEDA